MSRAARWCLALTAWSIPLSTTGMEVGIVGLVVLAALAAVGGPSPIRRTPLDGVIAVFFGALALSTLASGRPWEAVGWERPWVVLGYYGVYWWLGSREDAVRFARWLLLAGIVAALYGILQHYTGADWYRALLGRAREVRPRIAGAEGYATVGFFRSYLTYAHVMIFPLGLALANAVVRRGPAAVLAVPLLALALLFSTARGAWIAAVAMTAALVVATRRGLALVGIAAAAVAVAWVVSPGLRQQVLPGLTSADANAGRIAIYAANLDIVRDAPVFGLGFGRYKTAAAPYYDRHPAADRRSHAHNNFLQIAAEAGLVGLAAFGLLFAAALMRGAEAVAGAEDESARATALGAWLGILGFLVGGCTQYSFGDNEVATAMWAMLAVLMRLRER